jgi:hypothetical protein
MVNHAAAETCGATARSSPRTPQPSRIYGRVSAIAKREHIVPLEFRHDGLVVRVDGDVVEIFRRGGFSHRLLLPWLTVQVQPSIRGRLVVRIMSASGDAPLYEVQAKARNRLGGSTELVIRTEEEPIFRQFFTQLAQQCGRPVVLF